MCLGAVLDNGFAEYEEDRLFFGSNGNLDSTSSIFFLRLGSRSKTKTAVKHISCAATEVCWPRVYVDDDVLQDGGAWILTLPTLLL